MSDSPKPPTPVLFPGHFVFVSADGRMVVVFDIDGQIWAIFGEDHYSSLGIPELRGATALCISPCGELLALAMGSSVYIVCTKAARTVRVLGHYAAVTAAAWDPQGRYFATGTQHGTLTMWCIQTGVQVCSQAVSPAPIAAVAWSPVAALVAVSSVDGVVCLLHALTLEPIWANARGGSAALAWHPDGQYVLAGSAMVPVDNAAGALPVREFPANATCYAWSRRGGRLAAATSDGTVTVSGGAHDGRCPDQRILFGGRVDAVAWMSNDRVLLVCNGHVHVWAVGSPAPASAFATKRSRSAEEASLGSEFQGLSTAPVAPAKRSRRVIA